jgi:hypothetical protein
MTAGFDTERLTIRELYEDDLLQIFDGCASNAGWGQASA